MPSSSTCLLAVQNMVIRVYWASVTGNRKVNSDQTRLRNLIESLKLESKWIDITQSRAVMDQMRSECSAPKAMPPQIFNDDIYLGTVDDMNMSIEEGRLNEWLRLDSAGNDTTENGKVQCHPGEADNAVFNSIDFPPPPPDMLNVQTSATTNVNNLENARTSPKIARKTVEFKYDNSATQPNSALKEDEARRRRILGLSPAEEDSSTTTREVVPQDTNGALETSVSKIKSLYEVKNAA